MLAFVNVGKTILTFVNNAFDNIFNERKLVLGLALVMLCNVSEPKKVSKQYSCAKVGLTHLILLA